MMTNGMTTAATNDGNDTAHDTDIVLQIGSIQQSTVGKTTESTQLPPNNDDINNNNDNDAVNLAAIRSNAELQFGALFTSLATHLNNAVEHSTNATMIDRLIYNNL